MPLADGKPNIDLPIKEFMFKAIVHVSADTVGDAKNILEHLNSSSVTIDILHGFDEGETNHGD